MRPRAYLLLSLLIPLLGLALAGNAAANTADFTIAGQHAIVQQPDRPTSRVVLYVHGSGERTLYTPPGPAASGRPTVMARLLADGYSIASIDAHGNNWGNTASVRDYVRLVAWLRAHRLTRVYVFAQSMGGLDATRLIGLVHPVAWAAVFPVCDPRTMLDNPSYEYSIRDAHPDGIPAALSPARPTRARGLRGLRMMFWASPGDTIVPKASNTDVCASYARAHGAKVKVVTTRGDHGDPSNFRPAALSRFYGR